MPVKYVRDCVSLGEIDMLHGRTSGGSPDGERWLWPPPELLEKYCDHYHGIITAGCKEIFDLLVGEIKAGRPNWRTRVQWIDFFKDGQKKKYTPKFIPKPSDYKLGWSMLDFAYPDTDWNFTPVLDVVVLEIYKPHIVNPGGGSVTYSYDFYD
ncbi:hypothetical protein C8R45DRAFT_834305 [Mycena sanguinolenta]|nr:hypothetical protein C8R45DRAFT_834305 [Mycena sanguinolenta]